jgi:hypothetical protein
MASLARRNRVCLVALWPLVSFSTFLWRLRALGPPLTLGKFHVPPLAFFLEIRRQPLNALDISRRSDLVHLVEHALDALRLPAAQVALAPLSAQKLGLTAVFESLGCRLVSFDLRQ